jgi:hypothetical protein
VVESNLTAAQRRERAGQIRDAATANGITQGWLLAGIADSETSMSQCWSELTWACMGPYSADCGGPVVAGAGDGPCADRQGGLGMFQFDAGTYDMTLAREGDRVLSIAGNVAAAVDFVIAMVIRSVYISGVDTREQAIAWINDVRIDNGQWDAWVRTTTHYYNGCTPSASCFPSRYARYRDHMIDIYNEMGASFWVTRTWGGAYVHQTFPFARDPFPLTAGSTFTGYLEMRNTGTETWTVGHTFLGTTEPRDVDCPFAGADWVNGHRAATVDHDVPPGETGRFNFTVRAPAAAGDYDQFFSLVEEGVTWFADSGGPPDRQIEIRVTSTPAPTCEGGIGPDWSCDGADRVRCDAGMVFREPCEFGCASGVCTTEGPDADGDGFANDDCDDTTAAIFPGASEVCEDGVDQDCDGVDVACPGNDGGSPRPDAGLRGDGAVTRTDGGTSMGPRGSSLSGGCSVGHRGTGGGSLALLGLAMVLVVSRRRR